MISNIKELIKKITEVEDKISFVEKQELIESNLKNLYIEKISQKNEKNINENNILIKSEKNTVNEDGLHFMDTVSGIGIIASILCLCLLFPLFMNKNFSIDTSWICVFTFWILVCFFSCLYRKKFNTIMKRQSDEYYDEKSLLPNQYMYKHYKKIAKESTVDLIKELELIKEPELQKNKKYISDYLVIKTFEFEEEHTHNIFHDISEDIKEKIFIPEDPLKSKKMISNETSQNFQDNKIILPNIEEIKLKLINDVNNKVISK